MRDNTTPPQPPQTFGRLGRQAKRVPFQTGESTETFDGVFTADVTKVAPDRFVPDTSRTATDPGHIAVLPS